MDSIHNQAPFAIQTAEQSSSPVHGAWSVPWSDLMMVMFILFLVLFIFHAREKETIVPRILFAPWGGSLSQDNSQLNLDPLYDRARAILGADSSRVSLEHGTNGDLIVSLFGNTFFSPGSTELNPGSGYYLAKISDIISLAQGSIVVSGFADSSKKHENAWEISSVRASRVGQSIGNAGQIRKENIVIHGYGTSRPLIPGHLAASGERNRRVEIRILGH